MPDEKTKSIGLHTIKVKKYLSEDGERIICDVGVNDNLRELLRYYAVFTKPKQDDVFGNFVFKRYLIKNVLRNSINMSGVYPLLFTEELIKEGSVVVSLASKNEYMSLIQHLQQVRDLIRVMEELKQEESVNVEVKVRKNTE